MAEPRLRIVIPDAPAMKMSRHPHADTAPHARLMGSSGDGFNISVLVFPAEWAATPADCAKARAGDIVRRFELKREAVVSRRNDERTFVLLFAARQGEHVAAKAFFLTRVEEQCVEVHLSKVIATPEEIKPWLAGFGGARLAPY